MELLFNKLFNKTQNTSEFKISCLSIYILKNSWAFIVIFTLSIFLFSSCNKQSNDSKSLKDSTNHFNDTILSAQENPKLVAYRTFVDQLDSANVNSVGKAVEQFKTVFANERPGLCDTAFVVFQQLLDTMELKLNQKLQSDTTDYLPMLRGAKVSAKIKNFQQNLYLNGFRLMDVDEMFYIQQYRPYVIQQLGYMLSDTLKVYLNEIEIENREGFSQNEAIIISAKQLVDRTLWYENFIKSNPNFIFINNCQTYKKAYLTYLFSGYGKTKLYAETDKSALSPFFLEAYNYLFTTYPQSEISTFIQPYYVAINQKQPATVREIKKKYVIKGLIYNLE